ncbi:MAG TPA: hypothetical protein VMF33_01720 [Acidimicrobiales bacterium]|nr:hypothetical protein [Acidimicrobiales bacterium]
MSHRLTTWWRVLSVVLLGLAMATWPSASWAEGTPSFSVLHQGAVASLSSTGTARFGTTIAVTSAQGLARMSVSLYPVITARSELAPIVNGQGPGVGAIATTGTFDLKCLTHGQATFIVTLYTASLASPPRSCDGVAPRLRLACSTNGCGGVYPIRYELSADGRTLTKWSLLSVQSTSVDRPLQVTLVVPLTPRALRRPTHFADILDTLGRFPDSAVTLGVNYSVLANIQLNPTRGPIWVSALERAMVSPLHRVIDAPSSTIDFAGLDANHLASQVGEQFTLTSQMLAKMTSHYMDDPVVLSGAQSPASLAALNRSGFNQVILPESDLAEAPSSTLTWGAPFHVVGAGALVALSDDGPLSQLTHDKVIEPGRRAAMVLATLAFLHFEEPFAPNSRSVVLETPANDTSDSFLSDLLSGLHGNPFSQLVSLSPSFSATQVGADGAPVDRTLSAPQPSTWSAHNVSSLLSLIGQVNSFAQSVRSSNIATVLRVAVASSETEGGPSARQSAINAAAHLLDEQLAQFSIDQSTITLAGSGTDLPITVLSRLHYTVETVVHLVTDRVSFPKGNSVELIMNSPTESIRVPVSNAQGSSLTLQVILTTPNGQVILARTAIQVRIAGTSVVGYVITFASLFVLALWWWRTIRRRPKGRHAR